MRKRIKKMEFIKMVHDKVRNTETCNYWNTYWIVKAVFDCMADILETGDCLYIREYFTLYSKKKKDKRTGNFGNPMIIPEHFETCFKPHKRLKEACKSLEEHVTEIERGENDEM